jgi:hypothetical protein
MKYVALAAGGGDVMLRIPVKRTIISETVLEESNFEKGESIIMGLDGKDTGFDAGEKDGGKLGNDCRHCSRRRPSSAFGSTSNPY